MDKVEVTQADRDAACSLIGHEHDSWWRIKTERSDGSPIVQAFARHRLAALEDHHD